jgi:hypothetical protein
LSASGHDGCFSQFEHAGLIIKKPAHGILAELPAFGNFSDRVVGFDSGFWRKRKDGASRRWISSGLFFNVRVKAILFPVISGNLVETVHG